MLNYKFYLSTLILFLISLFQLNIKIASIYVSISDLTICLLSLSIILFNLDVRPNKITYGIISYIIICCISGLVNYVGYAEFDLQSFLLNLSRLLVICFLSMTIHNINTILNKNEIKNSLEFVLIINAIIVIILWSGVLSNAFNGNNTVLLNGSSIRNSGFFVEPSFYCIWVIINLFSLISFNKLYGFHILSIPYFVIIILSMIITTSVFGFISLILIIIFFIPTAIQEFKLKNKKNIILIFLVIFLSTSFFHKKIENNYNYIFGRLSGIETLSDGSSRQRLYGGALLFLKLVDSNTFFGVGLGGANAGLYINKSDQIFPDMNSERATVTLSSTNFYTVLMLASGLSGLILYFIFLLYILKIPTVSHVAFGMIFCSIAFGGVFDLWLWMYILYFYSINDNHEN